jgi:CRISPR-associated protein Cas1
MLPPLKPIPMKDRISIIFIGRSQVDAKDGAFVSISETDERTHIPVGSILPKNTV